MKKILFCTFFLLATMCSYAQENKEEPESVKATLGITIKRDIELAVIEYPDVKKFYFITVELRASSYGGVTIIFRDPDTGKKLLKKYLGDSYLYIYKSGQLQIGRPNIDKAIIYKSSSTDKWNMVINEGGLIY